MRRQTLTILACLAGLSSAAADAQFPSRAITLVVPFPAGSTTDSLARAISQKAQAQLGQPVVVENKPGAEGQIAALDVARAVPDGHRITLATSGNFSLLPALRIKLPFDVMEDFTPIADIGRYGFVFYVNSKVPARTLAEFAAYARQQPGKLSYATGNNTGIVTFAQLKTQMGISMVHVPYKGEPPAMQDLIAGRIDAMVGTTIGLPFVADGKLRALAVLSPARSPVFPSTPTLEESGFGTLPITSWAGVLGPKGMPTDAVARLSAAFVAAASDSQVQQHMEKLGFPLTPGGPAQLRHLMQEQLAVHARLVKSSGLQPE